MFTVLVQLLLHSQKVSVSAQKYLLSVHFLNIFSFSVQIFASGTFQNAFEIKRKRMNGGQD